MNIRELANFCGKEVRTVRRWIVKAGEKVSPVPHDKMSQGIAHEYSLEDIEEILVAGTLSKDAVSILMENARNANLPAVNNQIDYEAIGKMIGMAVTAALTPIVHELREIKSTNLLPAPVKEDIYSLVGYCAIKGMKINRSELALHGKELKKIANRDGIILNKIPDERWGFVNSYPVGILDEYFAV